MSDNRPTIPPKVRSAVYFVLLAVAALALGVETLAPIWADPATADKLARTAGGVVGVAALIGGGLGVTYRPTRNGAQAGTQAPNQARFELGD